MLKYRFKQDNGNDYPDWDNFTLDKCCNCFDSKRIPISEQNRIKGSYPYYGANGIQDYVNDYIFDGEYMLLAEDGGHYKEYKTRPIAQYVTGKFWVNNHAHILQSKDEFYNKFVFYCLEHKNIIPVVKGSTRGKLNQSDMWKIKISIPVNYEEQQKIADFFTAIDNQIDIQRQRVENMETQKKGLLDKVFSQELRFKRDDGSDYPDWKESSIESDFNIKMCKRILKKDTQPNGDVPFYKIGTLGKTPDSFISNDLYQFMKENYNSPSVDDTLISCSGTLGKCTLYDGKPAYFQDSNIVWLVAKNQAMVNKKFLYYVLSRFTWNKVNKTTIGRIYSNDLNRKIWHKPCPEEQQKIADFFTAIDNQIDIEKQRLTTMETIKKGLLQQMFC